MAEVTDFGAIVLLVAAGFAAAILSTRLSERIAIPAPAFFLLAAAVTSEFFTRLETALPVRTIERITVVALIVILFDGGARIGWRRFRVAALPVATLGIVGTFATAGILALAAHFLLGLDWTVAGLVGAALSPTDPAMMFSVLGGREIVGPTATILEGESGVNDPVGIALMLGLLDRAQHPGASLLLVGQDFAIGMAVGLVVGVVGALALVPLVRRVPLSNEALYPLRTLAFAGVVYGLAAVLHGSGFLAVFIAGILLGDADVPHKKRIERFHTSLASLAEIVAFVALGLTVDLTDLAHGRVWLDGLALAFVLVLVARPLAVGPLLAPVRLRAGERIFVIWAGLRGAVPIVLGMFALLAGVHDGRRIYGIVFVVTAFSVLVQGATIPAAARWLGIRMRAS